MTRWETCRVKGCDRWVLAYPGVPQYCPACLRARRQELYQRYLHHETQA